VNRPIGIGRPQLQAPRAGRPWAAFWPGRNRSGADYPPHRAPRAKEGLGPRFGCGPNRFFYFLFTEHSIIVFCSVFEQICYSFFYSSYSNENLFREFKSYRNFLKSLKFMNFIHVSAANS
jgi:hypothetical protein